MSISVESCSTIALLAAFVVVSLAVYTDLRWRKISNKLTIPAIAAGIVLNTICLSWYGLLSSLAGFAIGIAVFIIPFALRGMGGGDVKLMGALGALLGGYAIFSIALYTAVCGGLLAVVVALYNHELGSSLRKVIQLLRRIVPINDQSKKVDTTKSLRIPYGLAIGAGTVLFFIIGRVI